MTVTIVVMYNRTYKKQNVHEKGWHTCLLLYSFSYASLDLRPGMSQQIRSFKKRLQNIIRVQKAQLETSISTAHHWLPEQRNITAILFVFHHTESFLNRARLCK